MTRTRLTSTGVYCEPQSLDHDMGQKRCIEANAAGSEQSTKCSSAGV